MVSKNGYNSAHIEFKFEGGSFDYFGGSLSSGIVFGRNDLFTSISYNNSKRFRKFNKSSRLNALINIGRKFNNKIKSRLYINYTNLNFNIPGPLTQNQINKNPKQINIGINPPISIGPNVLRDKPGRNSNILRLANKSVYKINKNNEITLGLKYQYGNDSFIFPIAVRIRNSFSNDLGFNVDFKTKSKKILLH